MIGDAELRELYDALWQADVDAATLDLCRVRLAQLLGVPVTPEASADVTSPTDAQRAALAYTEQYVLDVNGFTDTDADLVKQHFTLPQIATLTIAVATFDAMTRVRAMTS